MLFTKFAVPLNFLNELSDPVEKQVFTELENYFSLLSLRKRQYLLLRIIEDWFD
ncbi:hypothetical protein [Sporolactobacillus pectinivorans]|uniref:hypothetical protein n=1 Tax=Sporolactobacillus pectinivorans TaxID=1591408 RepID=UPI0012FD4FB6|nr:hypothetical protein [Sporolactobacillus pectinivorans]